ncbi:MAG: hypothetical protein JWP90_758 [Mycetocola sp.]|nr:hypothetical protein [Mycetocola sp.]
MVVFARRFHAVCGDAGSGTAVCGNATSATRPQRSTAPGTVPFVHPAHTTGSRRILRHSGRMKHPADRGVGSSVGDAGIAPRFSTSGADERAAGARRWFIRRTPGSGVRAGAERRATASCAEGVVRRPWAPVHDVATRRPDNYHPPPHNDLLPPVVTATCCRASSRRPVAVRRHDTLLPCVVTTACCRASSQRPPAYFTANACRADVRTTTCRRGPLSRLSPRPVAPG